MDFVNFKTEGLSSDYGDITIENVTGITDVEISINNISILHELYVPDLHGRINIRDIGNLISNYFITNPFSFGEQNDTQILQLSCKIRPNLVASAIIFQCDAITDGITPSQLKKIPLTSCTSKKTAVGRKEFVSFYNQNIYADINFISGHKMEKKTIQITSIPDNNQTYRINISPYRIASMIGINESMLSSYTIYNQSNEAVELELTESYPTEIGFAFINLFGVWETFYCTGEVDSERKWSRSFGNFGNKQVQISRTLQNTYTVNTGFINKEQVLLVESLLNSKEVHLIEDEQIMPVVIQEESAKITSHMNSLINIEFKYRYADNNQLRFNNNIIKIFDFTFDNTFN